MKNLITTTLSLFWITIMVQAQTDTLRYFESYFETTADRQQWSSMPADNNIKWEMDSKGGHYDEEQEMNYNPDTAYSGEYNAIYFWSDFNPQERWLVSKPIDLSDSKKPELSFGHAMYQSFFGTDRLTILFRAGSTAPWDTIYPIYSTPVNAWTERTYNIKDFGTKYLCNGFQMAFKGISRAGLGICIDNVVIEEKDIIIRHVKSTRIRNVIQNPLPSSAMDIPVMRVDINIVGNTDPILLNSIVFTSLSTHDSLFSVNGFELVATKDSSYQTALKGASLKIGSPVSISGGNVTFNNLNYNLSTGYNAIWLIADVKKTAPHKSVVDFKLGASAMNIKGSTFPVSEASPAGFCTVEESVFYDSFEGLSTWTIESDFETAVPKGYTADITEDPAFAYSGTKILGTDLTIDGKYRFNINSANAYYATTPVINLQYYTDVKLSFKKWIAFEGKDQGVIEVTNDNGVTWHKIWDSKVDGQTPDNDWVSYLNSGEFNALTAHQPSVRVRFGIVYADNIFSYAGFNIDNFAITGNYLTNDVGLVDVTRPVNDCHNPGMDSVRIVVHNYADNPTASSVPVFFSIDGSEGNRVLEYIPGPIPKDGTVTYTFTHTADFPGPGDYNLFTVKLQAVGDEDQTNDTRIREVFIQKSESVPDHENFENNGGYWKRYGSDPRWQCKIPEGSVPPVTG